MKEYKIQLEETVEYIHGVEILLPKDVNPEDVWNKVDGTDSKDDIYSIVKSFGGTIKDFCEDGSGETEVCVFDVECMNDEEEEI